MISAAVFDWDGTLSDSRAALLAAWYESTEAVIGRRYPSSAAEEDVVFTQGGLQIWPVLAADAAQEKRLADAFQQAYDRHGDTVRAFPGIAEMLATVREAGLKTAVVTSKGRRRFEPDADRIGLAAEIDVAVCSGEAPPKPDPGGVLEALARLGVDPADAAMVGDTPVDIAAGVGAGVTAIGVDWGHSGGAALRAAGAHAIAETPAELTAMLTHATTESRTTA